MRVLSVKGVRGDWKIAGRGRQLSAKSGHMLRVGSILFF